MSVDAVLFDLDGTLADTAPDLGAAANRLRADVGLPPLPLEILRPHTSSGVRGMLHAALDTGPQDSAFPDLSARFLAHYRDNLCVASRLFDRMHELLDALEGNAIKWGIVTNKRSTFTDPLVDALGLSTRACCVVSGDAAPRLKPAPDTLLLACQIASLDASRCIYVGDDQRDIEAGRNAGMTTVAAAYGYLGLEVPVSEWQADHIIHGPMELLQIIGL
ncbi:MAG TPA: HAD-IA family hydrolase [Azoarcus taiwanensis]|nr:HAD-IA family hydrolase [Azoarcus taiwanensis]